MVCRAHLLAGARVVEVEWECPFAKIVASGMSCRRNAIIDDPRLPGGVVLGKVVSYEMTGDGDDGEFLGRRHHQLCGRQRHARFSWRRAVQRLTAGS